MNRIFISGTALLFLLTLASSCMAAEGYEILFKGTNSKLSKKEKQQIFKKLDFELSKNKKSIVDSTCGDVSPSVEIIDLNGDGVEEVFVSWGNSCTSGMTGSSISLFIKDPSGQFIENLGFPAGAYHQLETKNKGFPDIELGGPGFCHGVWQWDGAKYVYKCSREEEPGGCDGKNVEKMCQ
jgi:hypothetical protein